MGNLKEEKAQGTRIKIQGVKHKMAVLLNRNTLAQGLRDAKGLVRNNVEHGTPQQPEQVSGERNSI